MHPSHFRPIPGRTSLPRLQDHLLTLRHAFSLIEALIVTIAILVVVSLAFPAASRARADQRRQVNLSNILTIGAANGRYLNDYSGSPPVFATYSPRYDPARPNGYGSTPVSGYCPWSFGGKNNSSFWATTASGIFDIEAADRPLNPYVTPDIIEAPPRPQKLAADSPLRASFQIPTFEDPSDFLSHQRDWPNANSSPRLDPNYDSAYDDVGTSYSWNGVPLNHPALMQVWGLPQRFNAYHQRVANHQFLTPSRFVLLADQWLGIVIYSNPRTGRVTNGYKDVNTSVMGFLDGSAAYNPVKAGLSRSTLINSQYRYELTFTDLAGRPAASNNPQVQTTEPETATRGD